MKKFTVVTPIYLSSENKDRLVPLFQQCIESIKNQTIGTNSIEHIIINDGSSITVDIPNYSHIKLINQPNLNRVSAYETGFKASTGEIICMLDSDDSYDLEYLHEVAVAFMKYPMYKMFNFGCKLIHSDGKESTRGAFKPKKKKIGHEVFSGGNIVNGTFVFHRSIYDDLGGFPSGEIKHVNCSSINYPAGGNMMRTLTMSSPYDFSAYAQVQFPEIRKYFMVNVDSEPNKIIKELGNPWGQDFYLFYKYTRKYWSKPFDKYLLKVNLK